MKKKLLLIISIVIIILILLLSFYNSYFSTTYGKVLDQDGKGIIGAKVEIRYLCTNFLTRMTGGPETSILSTKRTTTNNNGEFTFKRYLGRPNLFGCKKYIFSFKEGYCKNTKLCASELSSPEPRTEENIKVGSTDRFYLIYHNGFYYDSYYFQDGIIIGSKDKKASLRLNKLEVKRK